MEWQNLLRRGLLLETLTLLWNVVGVGVVLWAALRSHSVALAGFGLDSLIEIGASTVVIWELSGTEQRRQKRALRLIGAAFLALALYISSPSPFAHFFCTFTPKPLFWGLCGWRSPSR